MTKTRKKRFCSTQVKYSYAFSLNYSWVRMVLLDPGMTKGLLVARQVVLPFNFLSLFVISSFLYRLRPHSIVIKYVLIHSKYLLLTRIHTWSTTISQIHIIPSK